MSGLPLRRRSTEGRGTRGAGGKGARQIHTREEHRGDGESRYRAGKSSPPAYLLQGVTDSCSPLSARLPRAHRILILVAPSFSLLPISHLTHVREMSAVLVAVHGIRRLICLKLPRNVQ